MNKHFDAIIVGGGHAGIEAVFALANRNFKVALVTLDKNKIGLMPCNPAIGGPAKGILTREIDALGGLQGILSDQAMIQIKMLNESKGPAVRALRAQIDKDKYSELALEKVLNHPNITLIEDMVNEIIVTNQKIVGLKLESNLILNTNNVILTTGTYMDSRILRGQENFSSGPDGQKTSSQISVSLIKLGFNLQRLKTGTPPRVLTSSIDFSQVEKELLSAPEYNFSSRSKQHLNEQIYCYLTYTNEKTHEIIRKNLTKSSMYSGAINGIGPRYCPSIEDKVVRFSDKDCHQIFYEPETKVGDVIYVNGMSTSMPIDVQAQLIKTLPGMKNAIVTKWGYAIEYDAIDPLELKSSLESKRINGLWFAGQVNGTSGYEEAASQGLIAGINVGQKILNKLPIVLRRDQAYIGVLIDDLITKGTREPYRMLTSRAEYRLLLRNDNADERLSHIGHQVNLISDEEFKHVKDKYQAIDNEIIKLSNIYVSSNSELGKKYQIVNGPSYLDLLKRPEVNLRDISNFEYIYEVAVRVKLSGYIIKQQNDAQRVLKLENMLIPQTIDYHQVGNLAAEARAKLLLVKPHSIGQAMRISGINPSDIQMIIFYLKFKHNEIPKKT